jgi:hypothetical protein
MFTGSDKDRRMIAHIQAEMRRQAAQEALAQAARAGGETSSKSRTWVVVAIVIVLVVLLLFTGYLRVYAHEAIDVGTSEPFANAMVAEYRAHHSWITGFHQWNTEGSGTKWSNDEGCLAHFAAASVR